MAQEKNLFEEWKKNTNFAHFLGTVLQRAVTIPLRRSFGIQAIGFPCFWALILMLLWYVFSHDAWLLYYIVFWLVCLVVRRVEAGKLAGKIHSQYDGWPEIFPQFRLSEKTLKLYAEPLLIGVAGTTLFWFYREHGWPVYGLPYFFLAGCISLPFVESVKQAIWERRLQGMQDAQFDQQMLMDEFQNRR